MTESGSLDLATAQTLLDGAPFHRWLGLRMVHCGEGRCEVHLPFREELLGDPDVPYVHGGILASLLDIAGDFAVASLLGRGVPTIDMRVDYLRTAGRIDLVGRASVVKMGRTLAVVDAEVMDDAQRKLAAARALYSTR